MKEIINCAGAKIMHSEGLTWLNHIPKMFTGILSLTSGTHKAEDNF